jgi:hypothetical protein
MLGGLFGALGEMEQVEIDLHRRYAVEAVSVVLAGEDAEVVGADELDIGSLGILADGEAIGDLAGVVGDVDRAQPEARKLVHRPRRRESGEGVMDVEPGQPIG